MSTKYLLDILFTGTIRKNRPMPITIKNANLDTNSTIYMRAGRILCMAHRGETAKKPVRLLSTLLTAGNLQNGKPRIVTAYNRNMGAVDLDDARLSVYDGERKTYKVWKKMIIHLFQRMLFNCYVLYTKNTSDRPVKSRLEFYQCVIESLATTETDHNHVVPVRRRKSVDIAAIAGKKEKDCCICSNRKNGNRRRSRTMCSVCKKGLHLHCVNLHMCNEI